MLRLTPETHQSREPASPTGALKAREIKVEELLDNSVIRELDESGFIKGLGLKSFEVS